MSVKERLKAYLVHKNLRINHFEKSIGASNSFVNNIRVSISPDKLENIANIYKDLNITWLLTGEGEMIKMEGRSLDGNNFVKEERGKYSKDSVTQMPADGHMEVEFRDLSVAGGPLNMTDEKAPKRTMLVPREYDRGEYIVVRVDGPSMDDGSIYSIPNGANILIKRFYLENGDRLPIKGNLFVIDAVDGQALKQIIEHNVEEGYIICHSYNPDFKDYRVDIRDVRDFYIFRKIVGFRPPVRDL